MSAWIKQKMKFANSLLATQNLYNFSGYHDQLYSPFFTKDDIVINLTKNIFMIKYDHIYMQILSF